MAWRKGKFSLIIITFQILFIVLFAIFVDYDYGADGKHDYSLVKNPDIVSHTMLDANYMTMFQDVHVMMFIGFGFLMTYMKRYGLSSVGLNMMTAAFTIQWAVLMAGFLHLDEHDGKIVLNIQTLFVSDFAAAAVLISFGAVLGRLSPTQMVIMAFLEIVVFQVNEWMGLKMFQAVDVGGSMFVHVFGAYFGIAMSFVLAKNADVEEHDHKNHAVYHSDLFSMIGTIFLWLFWPSFNSALAEGNAQHRAVINTYFALAASAIVTFAFSALVHKEDKIEMDHIQNATLAGGVAIGTSADMLIGAWGAMTVGAVAGMISVLGFKYITPFLDRKLKLKDTCGVNNLHGMPGIMAGVVGIINTTMASKDDYGSSLYKVFPAMAPKNGTELLELNVNYTIDEGEGRTPGQQALWQLVALGVSIGMAIAGGAIVGAVLRLPIWDRPEDEELFEDEPWWVIGDGQPEAHASHGHESSANNNYDLEKSVMRNEHAVSVL